MRNKKLFSLSGPLMMENLKLYWYLPVLSFLAYFMAGIFPAIIDRRLLTDPEQSFLESCLNNLNVFFWFLLIIVPLIAAVLMMNFLHKPAYAMALHAQPFSRNRIYCSQILTGWLFCSLPVLLMTLLYLLLTGMPKASLCWGYTSIAILTFFYGLYVLAGSLVGSGIMQLLLSGIFFGAAPLLTWLGMLYCENFLRGFYTTPEWITDFMVHSNPALYTLTRHWEDSGMPWSLALIYLGIGLLALILAGLAYKHAPLEKVGDSMIYRLFEEIITGITVFIGMTLFGFFLYMILSHRSMMLAGMAVGLLLTFVIVKIVIARSIRIFTRQNLMSLGIFAVLAMVFAGVVMFDLTGYGKWVPDAAEVASVKDQQFSYPAGYSYYNLEDSLFEEKEALTSPEAIERVLALHEYASRHFVDEEKSLSAVSPLEADSDNTISLTFVYEMKNGSRKSRQYKVRMNDELTRLLNPLFSCEEYRQDHSLSEKIKAEDISLITISAYDDRWEEYSSSKTTNQEAVITLTKKEEIADFLAALHEDDYNREYTVDFNGKRSYEIANGKMSVYCSIIMKEGSSVIADTQEIDSAGLAAKNVIYEKSQREAFIDFNLRSQDKNTLHLLRSTLVKEGYPKHAQLLEEY